MRQTGARMGKLGFWKTDWFVAVAIALVVLIAANGSLLQSLERMAYDMGVRATGHVPSDKVAVIAIDDQSIANIGRWPWSRDVHAKMIEVLTQAKAKVVGTTIFFSEPQVDPGLVYIDKLIEAFQATPPAVQQQLGQIEVLLGEAEQNLNTDRKLAAAISGAGSVVMPMLFSLGEPRGNPDQALPEFVLKNNLTGVEDRVGAGNSGLYPLSTVGVLVPLEDFGTGAAAVGHLNAAPDVDGSIRTEPLVLRYYDQFYPSLALMIAARSLNLQPKDVKVQLGEGVRLGNLSIRTDPYLQMFTYFYKEREGRPAFQVDSFYDVVQGKIPAEKYKDKIVLIGPTAAGVGTTQVTPISAAMAPVLTLAHSVSSILNENFFVQPTWGTWVSLAVFLLIAAYLAVLLPRLKAGLAAALTAVLVVVLIGTHFALMTTQLMWIPLMSAVVLLLVGHLALTTKRFLVTERGKLRSDQESAESNRMLGLAFQGQGQLDMAFDKFRKCPLDDSIMDNLYNLALDFERKRQFNKAQSVYEYMGGHNRKFRDLEQKLSRAKQMSETVILGTAGGRTNASTLILEGGQVEKPMLGRYQVEKELGKGAMGVVYLGRDPKIGRVVAIKTMALSQEFEPDELEDVKQRFFREAETAGRLNHPYIVTIFDAGEEHDLAYIAMEFLKGKDLAPHAKAGQLLPLPKMLSIAARVAEALSYAHAQSVVHRDIKPANIMYDPEADSVKVTDFGIARITDSSKTKTGMVLGTPSFMSPEQLAGQKIDGQSDLFSLGVTIYQLASGGLPFQGETMTQLMFKIANEAPADILALNPTLPDSLVAIIDKALAKEKSQRFATGDEMAAALRACAAELSASSSTLDVSL
ncbi:MAG: CHASE2 domain-containing protein [Burkholderiales bacterium]|nr:CHASE2 domain-containing protein [Burkholderiales bacterium]